MSGIIRYQSDSGKSGVLGSTPNFRVQVGTDHNLSFGSYVTVQWNTVSWDVSGTFNNTNSGATGLQPYSFKAPIGGTYSFSWILGITQLKPATTRMLTKSQHWDSSANVLIENLMDGHPDHYMDSDTGGSIHAESGSCQAKMRAGDFFFISVYTAGSGTTMGIANTHSCFNGWYTGPDGR